MMKHCAQGHSGSVKYILYTSLNVGRMTVWGSREKGCRSSTLFCS